MRKLLFFTMLCLLMLAGPASAQGDANVIITWPPPVYAVTGTIPVSGTVNPPNLRNFFLEISLADGIDERWTPISLPARTPVIQGVLGEWNTTTIPDGLYQIRVRVLLTDGQSLFAVAGPIRVSNALALPPGESVMGAGTGAGQQVTMVEPTTAPAESEIPRHPVVVNTLPTEVGGHIFNMSDGVAEIMRSAGMTWMKFQVPFVLGDDSLVYVAKDRVDFAHRNGFKVLLSITGEVNELAELGDAYYPRYAEFLARVAAQAPDAIEVWNEMNLDREWPTGRIDPRAYMAMLREAYPVIKATDPEVMVITGALAPTGAESAFGLDRVWNDDRYYQGMANAGVGDYADCIGVHYNEGIIPPSLQGGDPRTPDYPTRYLPLMIERAAFPFRGQDIPLCFTELGYLTPEGFGSLPQGFEWAVNTSVAEQSEWLRDAIAISAQDSRVALVIVWNVDSNVYGNDPQAGYAIIRPDGSCPACETISSLSTQG